MKSNNPLNNSHVNTYGAVKPKRQLYGKKLKGRKRQFLFLKISFWQNKAEHQAVIDVLAYSKLFDYEVFLKSFYRFSGISQYIRSFEISKVSSYKVIFFTGTPL